MRIDAQLSFVPVSYNQSLVGGAGVSIPSVNTIDLLGQGVGTAPVNVIGVTATTFGTDVGIGGEKPQVDIVVGTAFATSSSATLNVALQAAVDQGSGGAYQPGSWTTLMETGAIAVANLTAGQVIGRFDFPPAFPPGQLPRYLRLLFQLPNGASFTAGTIASAVVTTIRDDQANRYAAKNYKVQ